MKKVIVLFVAFLLLLTACSVPMKTPDPQQNATNTPAPAETLPEKKVTIHAFQYALENQQVDFENLWFYKELEEKTNVHVEWEVVKDSDWKTRLNLMFVSGDWADIIIRGNIDVEEYGVTQNILLPLDDHLKEHMPNYYGRLQLNNANASIPASDGKSYYVGNLTAQNVNHDGNHYINKKWLDNLGLEIPKTIDELTDVLRAFRDNDPNGNGQKDEIPFSGGDLISQVQGVYTHFANFGVPLQRFVYASIDANDKVEFPGYMDGFRAAVEWLNLCYNEGLLDPEAITQDSNVWGSKMNKGQVGYTTYLRLLNTSLKAETIEQFVSILPPASEYGVAVPSILEVPSVGAALTVANKHVPETLKWLDAQFETETMMVSVNGPIKEGSPIDPTMSINAAGKYEIKYIPENNGLYQYVPVYHGQFFAPGDYYFDIYEMPPHRVERFETSKTYSEAGVLEPKSFDYLYRLTKMKSEDSIEASRLFNEIDKFMQESITNFITNGVNDGNWETFIKTSKSVGVEEYISLYQKAYDNYLATQ